MSKQKKLCKWNQEEFANNFENLAEIVDKSKYACTKCGRAARKEKWLCEPASTKLA